MTPLTHSQWLCVVRLPPNPIDLKYPLDTISAYNRFRSCSGVRYCECALHDIAAITMDEKEYLFDEEEIEDTDEDDEEDEEDEKKDADEEDEEDEKELG